jgi:hypothetical protein
MSRIDPTLIAVIVAVVVCIIILKFLIRPKRPPTASYKCARCGTVARHTERTVEAWRRNASRLYCDVCHRKWLEAQPRQIGTTTFARASGNSNRGCLGILLTLAVIPIALVALLL